MRTAKDLVGLRGCAGSPEPLLVACDKYHNLMSWLILFTLFQRPNVMCANSICNDIWFSFDISDIITITQSQLLL